MSPDLGVERPEIVLSVVLLPAPFAPRSDTISLFPTSIVTLLKAIDLP